MIEREDLYQVLSHLDDVTPVKIKRFGDVLTVNITKVQDNDKVWGRALNEVQDTLIYPTNNVDILKIGFEPVQTKAQAKEAYKEYMDVKRFLAREEKRKLYIDAYKHNKKYPSVD